jgi:hypothetical protein
MLTKTLKTLATCLALLVFTAPFSYATTTSYGNVSTSAATLATTTKYTSCANLLKKYPNGVAKNKAAANRAVKEGFTKPKVSSKIYKVNSARLDRDKDGVMCETPL